MFPTLRNDLEIYPWEPDPSGQSQWVIHDPVRNRFFNISREVVETLARLDLGTPERVLSAISGQTELTLSEQQLEQIVSFLVMNELVYAPDSSSQERLIERSKQSKTGIYDWLVHRYLFFRVPLISPDRFLEKTKNLVSFAYRPWFFVATLIAALVGISLIFRNWSQFEQELAALWSFSGVVKIALSYVVVKTIHEFAHAYTAKRYGVRIPVMGIAFLVMFPLPYTDTSESWKLYKHRRRLNIASAGVLSELYVACWATLLWHLMPVGYVKDGLFVLATTTWISSLAVNLGPFMRFDGYFVLMDYLQIPNLHMRSGRLAQWFMREVLFGLKQPRPETFGRRRDSQLIAFAYVVWIYRLIVFIGIALLVYHFFAKVIGIVLFILEIYVFVLKPVARELTVWWGLRKSMRLNFKFARTLAVLLGVLLLVSLPYTRTDSVQGIYLPSADKSIFAREGGQIDGVYINQGDRVRPGDLIISVKSDVLSSELSQSQLAARRIGEQIQLDLLLDEQQRILSGRSEQWNAALVSVENDQARVKDLEIRSEFSGVVDFIPEDVQVGGLIAEGDLVAHVKISNEPLIQTFVQQELIDQINLDETVEYYLEREPTKTLRAKVVNVSTIPTKSLAEGELATRAGGGFESKFDGQADILLEPMFSITLEPIDSIVLPSRTTVILNFEGARESVIQRVYRQAATLLLREFDF